MMYRIWSDSDNKFWCDGQPLPLARLMVSYRDLVDSPGIRFLKVSDMLDRKGRRLGEGDVVTVWPEDGKINTFIVRYGTARRTMATGADVEINGFFFELRDDESPFHKGAYYQNYRNWQGGHDRTLTSYIGTIYDRYSRYYEKP